MKVVVALDSFGGTMRSDEAVAAFAAGWQEVAPADELCLTPLSDGGPGLVAALATAVPDSEEIPVVTTGPTGEPAAATILRIASTVYVESAQACGLDQLKALDAEVGVATTYGVGELVRAAISQPGVHRVVIGLGGSGTNDGGAGLWAGLGAEPAEILRAGGLGLGALTGLTGPQGGFATAAVQLVAASDVDNPLLGLYGASAVYGPQKGADQAAVMALDIALEHWAEAVESLVERPRLRDEPGAGAAGGLGFGILALGGERVSGIELVMDVVGLARQVEGADLLITGEGRFDPTSLRGKVASGVARIGQAAGVPCLVAAGQASVGAREAASFGIDEVWSVADVLGSADAAIAAGAEGLRALGREVAWSWSR